MIVSGSHFATNSIVFLSNSSSSYIVFRFIFLGFLPRSKSKQKDLILNLSDLGLPLVIFESPNRINKTINLLKEVDQNCQIFIVREMTKIFEEYFELKDNIVKSQGEISLIVKFELNSHKPVSISKALQTVKDLPKSKAAKILSHIYKIPKNNIYKLLN